MTQRNLKPIITEEVKEIRLDWMPIEEIIGRPYQKPKLSKPHFPKKIAKAEEGKSLKYWLNMLKKQRRPTKELSKPKLLRWPL